MKHISGWWCPDILSGPGKFLRRSEVIGHALRFWPGPKRRVIQAGAHVGIWPRMLAQYFEQVVCFEPEPANWACLMQNMTGSPRISCLYAALGPQQGAVELNVQPHSTGGHHVATRLDRPHVSVSVRTIDQYAWQDVDAIFLDIEGYELPTLLGARETLRRCLPLLVLEDNNCSRKYGIELGAVGQWLGEQFGYAEVGQYGEDRIYVAEKKSETYD